MMIKKYIDELCSEGKHFFTAKEIKEKFGLSDSSVWMALSRLREKGEITSPARGYYLIIPREYRTLGSLPPDHFIHALMQFHHVSYYVGLLSAAKRYGAAHQQPQVFQVMVSQFRKPIRMGRIKVEFIANKQVEKVPTRQFNTPRGVVLFSTPEATVIDLVSYPSHSGGLDNVLTVLTELVEEMQAEPLREALACCRRRSPIQRLGYMLELIGREDLAEVVEKYLKSKAKYPNSVLLDARFPSKEGEVNKRWRVIINIELESDV